MQQVLAASALASGPATSEKFDFLSIKDGELYKLISKLPPKNSLSNPVTKRNKPSKCQLQGRMSKDKLHVITGGASNSPETLIRSVDVSVPEKSIQLLSYKNESSGKVCNPDEALDNDGGEPWRLVVHSKSRHAKKMKAIKQLISSNGNSNENANSLNCADHMQSLEAMKLGVIHAPVDHSLKASIATPINGFRSSLYVDECLNNQVEKHFISQDEIIPKQDYKIGECQGLLDALERRTSDEIHLEACQLLEDDDSIESLPLEPGSNEADEDEIAMASTSGWSDLDYADDLSCQGSRVPIPSSGAADDPNDADDEGRNECSAVVGPDDEDDDDAAWSQNLKQLDEVS
ncbi:unnamed protein product [Protopolystoma xenopodis]|uniref:Uncharacterized protein n=1 Tax=Protopolystoma xenopodis TaxID=117903 RepID=A0A448X4T2_9PLAT|nr:unnamed protein product [Protopolystoma xenopodis]